jgi:hypothetical protein
MALLQPSSLFELSAQPFPRIGDPMNGMLTPEWRRMVSQEFTHALFGSDTLCRERLKLNVALHCSVS